jgi:aldehyde dehydrogenase (NAD+)
VRRHPRLLLLHGTGAVRVIGAIVTWNGPVVSLGMKVIPALAAGNCVVTKPSEFTPFAPDLYGRLLEQAGVPTGVCSILAGGPEAGAALVRNPAVEKVSFTGGPAAARQIAHACAEQLKPAVLELGGKTGRTSRTPRSAASASAATGRKAAGPASTSSCATRPSPSSSPSNW